MAFSAHVINSGSERHQQSRFIKLLRPGKFICCVALTCLALTVLNAQNLVTNPGFEDGTNGWFGNQLTTISANPSPYSGSACGQALAPAYEVLCGQDMLGKLQAGQTYSWSAYLRTSSVSATIDMIVNVTDSAGSRTIFTAPETIPAFWTLYSTTFSLVVTGALTDVSVIFQAGSAPETILYLDNVSITNSSPVLDLVPTNQSIFLSWPTAATNYTLQTATNIVAPINWATVTNTAKSNTLTFWLTLPATNPANFFRLQHP
jgi:hypothetical protein